MPWPALDAASAHDENARMPFFVRGRPVGSVARVHQALLARYAPWLVQHDDRVECAEPDDDAFAALHTALRAAGAILAWRDELFALFDPATLEPLARIERAAARFWGTLTLGAHANGYVRGIDGRPSHLWIARRSPHKATDPGRLDNLIGGGVPAGQSPREALVREAFEEAGLSPPQMAAAGAASVLRLVRDIPEGFQHEWLYAFDVELPRGLEPRNQDGEVAGFELLPVDEGRRLVEHGDEMTTDAALVTIDFLHRHGFVAGEAVARQLHSLRVQPPAR
jgi:8-oxo-dGTP pyrophosphatase MutT (NUDIX family)